MGWPQYFMIGVHVLVVLLAVVAHGKEMDAKPNVVASLVLMSTFAAVLGSAGFWHFDESHGPVWPQYGVLAIWAAQIAFQIRAHGTERKVYVTFLSIVQNQIMWALLLLAGGFWGASA